MKRSKKIVLVIMAVFMFSFAWNVSSVLGSAPLEPLSLSPNSAVVAGGSASGADFSIKQSVGQPLVGKSADSTLSSGFLYTAISQDSDDDGLADIWEMNHFGNLDQGPNDNPDGDHLINSLEFLYGTDPNAADPDGDLDSDGLSDVWEITNFTNLDQGASDNPDGDHLINIVEQQYGTDPNVADPDGDLDADGLSDVWEITYFNSLAQGPSGNPDGDHLNNLAEFQSGTNPNVADFNPLDPAVQTPNLSMVPGGLAANDFMQVRQSIGQPLTGVGTSINLKSGFIHLLPVDDDSGGSADDTDGDGLPDVWEMQHFGNLDQGPNDNPDGDHLNNAAEYLYGTDPNVFNQDGDIDGDGMKDSWEMEHFGTLSETADGDADSDGVSNHVEFLGNSDPNSAADKPKRGTYYEYDEIGRIKKIIRIK